MNPFWRKPKPPQAGLPPPNPGPAIVRTIKVTIEQVWTSATILDHPADAVAPEKIISKIDP